MADQAKLLYERATARHNHGSLLHVQIQGRSRNVALRILGVGADATDEAIRDALAGFMQISPAVLKHTVIMRHENGSMTLRAQANCE